MLVAQSSPAINHAPPISSLPPELLSDIFIMCLQSFQADLKTPPLMLKRLWRAVTRVCHYWRQVSLDTPQLWTHIDLNSEPIHTLNVPARHTWQYVTTFLLRSKQVPLSIHFHTTVPEHLAALPLILQESHRIRELVLEITSEIEGYFGGNNAIGPFTHLSTLRLGIVGIVRAEGFLDHLSSRAPSLRDLYVYPYFAAQCVSWPSQLPPTLTRLFLSGAVFAPVRPCVVAHTIGELPLLEVLHLTELSDASERMPLPLNVDYSATPRSRRLKEVHLSNLPPRFATLFLSLIKIPDNAVVSFGPPQYRFGQPSDLEPLFPLVQHRLSLSTISRADTVVIGDGRVELITGGDFTPAHSSNPKKLLFQLVYLVDGEAMSDILEFMTILMRAAALHSVTVLELRSSPQANHYRDNVPLARWLEVFSAFETVTTLVVTNPPDTSEFWDTDSLFVVLQALGHRVGAQWPPGFVLPHLNELRLSNVPRRRHPVTGFLHELFAVRRNAGHPVQKFVLTKCKGVVWENVNRLREVVPVVEWDREFEESGGRGYAYL